MSDREDKQRRPYEPPQLKLVDLVKLGKGSRLAAATPGYILAQQPQSTSNVTGGVVFGFQGPPPEGEDGPPF